jgi:hypothetical protein
MKLKEKKSTGNQLVLRLYVCRYATDSLRCNTKIEWQVYCCHVTVHSSLTHILFFRISKSRQHIAQLVAHELNLRAAHVL